MIARLNFNESPLLVIWEVTRSCSLVCRHCRASAEDRRHPDELTFREGKKLIEQIRDMGAPLLVLTGGDPLQRDDLEALVSHAHHAGLKVATIPAATPRLTLDRMIALKKAGLHQVAFSIDGATAEQHDTFRQVEGTFDRVMQGAAWAKDVGLPLQINTVFGAWNLNDFDDLAALVGKLGAVFWEVFLLVPVGRGALLPALSPADCEVLFAKLCGLAQHAPFVVKVTEGQHYRRHALQHVSGSSLRLGLSPQTVNAGRGICFVDHVGNICPSGFLSIPCGNVRDRSLADVYRASPVFRELRDTSLLKGRCRGCPYRELCTGGSRARAFAVTGDYLAADPWCAYDPMVI